MHSVAPLRSIPQHRFVIVLRASFALPFMFKPVHIDGRNLIDGFVADPLPFSAAADAAAVMALGFAAMLYLVDAGRRATEAALPAIHALLRSPGGGLTNARVPARRPASSRRAAPYSSAASALTAASASSVISSSAMYMSFTAALSCLLSSSNLSALENAATVPKPVMP